MEEKEYLNARILNNYVEMFKRKDIAAINDFMNNPKAMSSFLRALGASEEMMNLPAHRETLEDCLKSIVSSSLSAIKDGETDLEIDFEQGLKTHTESMMYEEKYTFEINDGAYQFEVARNMGETLKKVKGNVKQGLIANYTEEGYPREDSKVLIDKHLDENGFVVKETIRSKTEKKKIKREGIKNFVDNDKKGIPWNGKPYELSTEPAKISEFQANMCKTISKYPETKGYYENIVGKEIVDKVVKVIKAREENS